MQRTLFFKFVFTLIILIVSSNCETPICDINNDVLICFVINTSSLVNTTFNNSYGYNSIKIKYNGYVKLNLLAPSIKPILIEPFDETDNHILQILTVDANASRIDIRIRLSSNQASLPLFTTTSSVTAPKTTLSISITQNIMDLKDFKIFDDTSTSLIMNFANYEVVFERTSMFAETLYLHNLIRLLTNIASITIIGYNHVLVVSNTEMPLFTKTDQLSLKFVRLYDPILDKFPSLKEYIIEECKYNKSAQFLKSSGIHNLSITMKNNIPVDSSLPYHPKTFEGFQTLISLTLMEPKLNSSCLQAIKRQPDLRYLFLSLGSYSQSDMADWMLDMSKVRTLIINGISDLNIFPSKFFNKLHAIEQVTLQGTFELEKQDICVFTRINIQQNPKNPIIQLNNEDKSEDNICANIYITAINQRTIEGIKCPPNDTFDDCERWANAEQRCKLVSYESECLGETNNPGNIFSYDKSYLYDFFQNRSWSYRSSTTTTSSITQPGSVNMGAIIGALCGLVIAMLILGTTIFCIYRSRQRDSAKKTLSTEEEKYKPSSDDITHVSIATSKSSKSSRYALEKSFFPPMQPNDEIAPPLYTAPSESVGSVSNYRRQPVPSAPRESVLTNTTHFYETVDN
ncbi:unnamed protein product [Rotaria sp. Silwood1]|nr:unnamed protein product [Rotaria sp. Silwood1]